MGSLIIGTGGALPKKVVTNDDLSKMLDTSDEWITSRTGIRQRYVANASEGETATFLGFQAAQRAIEFAGISANEIELIIVSTVTADQPLPSAACGIQARLGLFGVPAFDISAACSGSVYGLNIADSFIKSGKYKTVLFVAVEILSSRTNWQDRNTAVLFGDGASAAILQASDQKDAGFLDFKLYADGRQDNLICIPAGGSTQPLTPDLIERGLDKIAMNGRETFKFAVRAMCEAIEEITKRNGLSAKDFTCVVPHQANLRIIEAIATRMDIPIERFLINLDRCANTSAASLLLVYDEANRSGRLKPGDLMLMLAIGAGFTWGAGIYRV